MDRGAGAGVMAETGQVTGSIRIGGDGRFGIPLVECASCGQAISGQGLVVTFDPEDYPRARFESRPDCEHGVTWPAGRPGVPGARWTNHLRESPACSRPTLPRGNPKPLPEWGRGIVAHVEA